MFIELHRANYSEITINLNSIDYVVPIENGTAIRIPNYNGWLKVTESYDKVKELIDNATRR